ncbi:MAG: phenylacetate-CoA oxygenase/reductase subunit PaaK [Saprospirales bacterium]|nr:phenylacetate-CoA oxygenase/reductase subunit PaaK [Saprospirales bacterium]
MPKFYSLKVKDVRKETADCVSVAFEVPIDLGPEYTFVHGQNLTLKASIQGEEVRRSYSICTSPLDGELRVAIKKVPGGRFSTFANEALQVGDTLDVMTPSGNFSIPLDPSNKKHYVAFVAGSGITPVLSILRTVLFAEPHSRFTLFFGNKSAEHIIFREQLENLKNRYLDRLSIHHVLSREYPGADLFYGRIDTDRCGDFCRLLLDPKEVDAYFLCGPEEMIFSVKEKLQDLEVDPKTIHFELFTSPVGTLGVKTPPAPELDKTFRSQIEVVLDGNAFSFELDSGGDTILDGALKAGADLPFACKGGVCATCKAKIMEGEVAMQVNYALEPDEVEAGFVLTCQSHPRSERVLVSYDE